MLTSLILAIKSSKASFEFFNNFIHKCSHILLLALQTEFGFELSNLGKDINKRNHRVPIPFLVLPKKKAYLWIVSLLCLSFSISERIQGGKGDTQTVGYL